MNAMQLPFERLKGRENFSTWKIGVKAHLITKGLWSYTSLIINTETKPEILRIGEKALAEIVLSIDSTLYSHVEHCTTAKEGWDALCTAFEDTGMVRKVALLKQWISLKLENCSTMQDYVNQCLTLRSKVKSAGFNIDEEVAGAIMLCGLSDQYKPMVMSIETNDKCITVDYVKNILLQEVEIDNEHEKVLFTKKKSFKKHNKSIKCYKCGGPHYQNKCPNKQTNAVLFSALLTQQSCSEDWYIDSGATAHMVSKENVLLNAYKPSNKQNEVITANMSRMQIKNCGSVVQKVMLNGETNEIKMTDVQHVPQLCANLMSVSQIVKRNYTVVFNKHGAKIIDEFNKTIATASLINNMFKLDVPKSNFHSSNIAYNDKSNNLRLWHRRLGHVSFKNLTFIKNIAQEKLDCDICIKGKQARLPFNHQGTRATKILEVVHSDVCGPISSPSIGGNRYFISFIDDFSRKVFIYTLKNKNQALNSFIEFKTYVEKQTGCQIKILRTDNGTEYVNSNFSQFLKTNGITHQRSAPYSPQQNGLAERMNRTLLDRVRCMLIDSKLPKGFWAEALVTAAKIVNSVPCNGTEKKSPEEAWSGNKPNISIFRVFGCKAFAHIPDEKRKKLDDKAIKCTFIGYAVDSKAYKLYSLKLKKVIISRDVNFIENEVNTVINDNTDNFVTSQCDNENATHDFEAREANTSNSDCASAIINATEDSRSNEQANEADLDTINDELPSNDSSRSNEDSYVQLLETTSSSDMTWEPNESAVDISTVDLREPSRRLADKPRPNYACIVSNSADPVSVKEAMACEEKEYWRNAMQEEMNSLVKNKTWTLAELPINKKPIMCKWVFKTKPNADSIRYKARLVAKGFSQIAGIDYDETFSPVVRYTSIRFLLAIAVKYSLNISQMDVVTAFLHSDLDTEIYMHQPELFHDGTNRFCKLEKSIYGLKQSSRLWNTALTTVLNKSGLKQSHVDPCIFYSITNDHILIVATYVDDLLILSDDPNIENKVKTELKNNFNIKDLGEASQILGIRITRDKQNGSITIDQTQYIQEVIKRFGMGESTPSITPMDPNQKLSLKDCPQTEDEKFEMRNIPYREATGSLQYAAQVTRPDIIYAVNFLSRFNDNPGKAHWVAVKRILRYLKGTLHYGINYNKTTTNLSGYCDSDWANCLDSRRSTTGYVFMLQGGAISWSSKVQKTVALSTAEAEFMSLVAAMQEAIWLKELEKELVPNTREEITIHCDNIGAVQLALNNSYSSRTKHVDIKAKFICETAKTKQIQIKQISTENMPADILTKSLNKLKLNKFLNHFGIK